MNTSPSFLESLLASPPRDGEDVHARLARFRTVIG